jgi:hypothetical protein
MVMDADNTVPGYLAAERRARRRPWRRLLPTRAFGAHPGLRSELGWSPPSLCSRTTSTPRR